MKILFLDMDGVLNSHKFFGATYSKRMAKRAKGIAKVKAIAQNEFLVEMIDREAVVHLNAVLAATGAVCVLSSSWRIPWPVNVVLTALREQGFTGDLIDKTPHGADVPPTPPEWRNSERSEYSRGLEIAAWLEKHPEVESFAIVDDSADMAHLMPRLVRTTWLNGLEAEHVEPLVKLLMETT